MDEALADMGNGEWAYALRAAGPDDGAAVRALLARCALPVAGLERMFPAGYVVGVVAGLVVGSAGLETGTGGIGLLRSVAVAPGSRSRGLGSGLVRDRLERARALGLERVYLLTTDAAPWFGRFGFQAVAADASPVELAASAQLTERACASALLMARVVETRALLMARAVETGVLTAASRGRKS